MNDAQLVSPGPDGSEAPDRPKILVVEDDPDIRKILEIFLTEKRFQVKVTDGADTALTTLDQEPVDVILSDVRMPGMSGLELLRHLKDRDPDIQLVPMSAYSSVKDAVEAIRLGAADYVEKPIDFRRLERVLQTVLEKRHLQHRTRILEQRLQGCVTFEGMVARSQQMLSVFAFIERLARYPTTALVTGESGTGKELVARALHELSPLRDRQLVICNCTTLAPTLLESELFGHTRGAFTGADRDRKGLFEAAHGGTIFLDEIGELPLGVQVKLLRVLANVIKRALVVSKGSTILPENLPPHLFETRPVTTGDTPLMPDLSLEAAEREQILRALQASGGKRVEAARRLGLSRRTLYRKLDRYGIA